MTCRVFYSPTPANCKIVSKLMAMPSLKDRCVFERLPENQQERIDCLLGIIGRGVFIYGDGYAHHESYYFTKNSYAWWKINYDQHKDNAKMNGSIYCG